MQSSSGTESPKDETEYKYSAFISYSRHDEAFARWLHRRLERYSIPRGLSVNAPQKFARSLYPVCLDSEEFKGAFSLPAEIKSKLAESMTLVVIASAHSANSPWVNREIEEFVRAGKRERIVVVSPTPGVTPHLPDALRAGEPVGLGASSLADEPLAVAFGGSWWQRQSALVKTVAPVLGVETADLVHRDVARRRKRYAGLAALVVAVAIGSVELNRIFERQRLDQLLSESEALALRADEDIRAGRLADAIDKLLSALPKSAAYDDRPVSILAESLLSQALYQTTERARVQSTSPIQSVEFGDAGAPIRIETEAGDVFALDIEARSVSRTARAVSNRPRPLPLHGQDSDRFLIRSGSPGIELHMKRDGEAQLTLLTSHFIGPVRERAQRDLDTLESVPASSEECAAAPSFLLGLQCRKTTLLVTRDWTTGAIVRQHDLETSNPIHACAGGRILNVVHLPAPPTKAEGVRRPEQDRVRRFELLRRADEGFVPWLDLADMYDVVCAGDVAGVYALDAKGDLQLLPLDGPAGRVHIHTLDAIPANVGGVNLKLIGHGWVAIEHEAMFPGRISAVSVVAIDGSMKPWVVSDATSYAVSSKGQYLAALTRDGELRVRTARGLNHQVQLTTKPLLDSTLRFSEDESVVVAGFRASPDSPFTVAVVEPFGDEVLARFAAPEAGSGTPVTRVDREGRWVAVRGGGALVLHSTRRHGPDRTLDVDDDTIWDHRLIAGERLAVLSGKTFSLIDIAENQSVFDRELDLQWRLARQSPRLHDAGSGVIVAQHQGGLAAFDLMPPALRWELASPGLEVHARTKTALLVSEPSPNGSMRNGLYGLDNGTQRLDSDTLRSATCVANSSEPWIYCYSGRTLHRVSESTGGIVATVQLNADVCRVYPLSGTLRAAVFTWVAERRFGHGGECQLGWIEDADGTVGRSEGDHGTRDFLRLPGLPWESTAVRLSQDGRSLIDCREEGCRVWLGPARWRDYRTGADSLDVKWADAVRGGDAATPELFLHTSNAFLKSSADEEQPRWRMRTSGFFPARRDVLAETPLALLVGKERNHGAYLLDTDTGLLLWSTASPFELDARLSPDGKHVSVANAFREIAIMPTLPLGGRALVEAAEQRRSFRASLDAR